MTSLGAVMEMSPASAIANQTFAQLTESFSLEKGSDLPQTIKQIDGYQFVGYIVEKDTAICPVHQEMADKDVATDGQLPETTEETTKPVLNQPSGQGVLEHHDAVSSEPPVVDKTEFIPHSSIPSEDIPTVDKPYLITTF